MPPVKKLVEEILNQLKNQKASIGSFEDNKQEILQFLKDRLIACDEDSKRDNLYPELVVNYAKLARLFEVLTVFKISEEDKQKYVDMGNIISQADCEASA